MDRLTMLVSLIVFVGVVTNIVVVSAAVIPDWNLLGRDEIALLGKRSQGDEEQVPDQSVHPEQKRDAALLLDKFMFALKRLTQEKEEKARNKLVNHPPGHFSQTSDVKEIMPTMDEENQIDNVDSGSDIVSFEGNGLERRGNNQNKVYWRCYFNAVSCF